MILEIALAAQIYNGLLYPEMGTIANAMTKRGQHVEVLWHDQEDRSTCPPYLLGHSMGANTALRQAARCAAAGRPPRIVVTIDPGRAPLFHSCPPKVTCYNLYNPAHAIGGQRVSGTTHNIIIEGYTHLQLPLAPRVVKFTLGVTK